MSNKLSALMIFTMLALAVATWVGIQIGNVRGEAAAMLSSLLAGEVPQGLGENVGFAEIMVEFGITGYQVKRIYLTTPNSAQASILVEAGQQTTQLTLNYVRGREGWQLAGAPLMELAVEVGNPPRLVLRVENRELLSHFLTQVSFADKLLTIRHREMEFWQLGWVGAGEYLEVFAGDSPARAVVGMDQLTVYAHGEKIAALVAAAPFRPDRVRVNISTSGFQGIEHRQVEMLCDGPWQMRETVSGAVWKLPPGKVVITASDQGMILSGFGEDRYFSGRLEFVAAADGLMQLASVTRAGGYRPRYRGILEVASVDGHLVIVNEIPLEQYLYMVLPSEMPLGFGARALEVQAVVARTYALTNILSARWQATSAHVVDSVLSQVYNNQPEDPRASQAVDATRGQVVTWQGEPADVRFFSTSCGYTGSAHQVWPDSDGDYPGKVVPWLVGRRQYAGPDVDLAKEDTMRQFIHSPPADAFDFGSPWFRWQVAMPADRLAEIAEENLVQLHRAEPGAVLQGMADGSFVAVEDLPAEPIGQLWDLVPVRRGDGGVLIEAEIVGSNGTWRVQREYNIRQVLRPVGTSENPVILVRHDGSALKNFALLPSAYVVWELERWDGVLQRVVFHGGGYGHGVGMSQYGVRELAGRGWPLAEIIRHYFPGTEIEIIN